MDLYAVKAEIVTALLTMTGLRSATWTQSPVAPPFALVGWPDSMDYQQTYGRGTTRVADLPMLLIPGNGATRRAAEKTLGAYVAETGAKSIPALLEAKAGTWVAFDTCTVKSVGFPGATVGGTDYLAAAEFHLDISGRGA